MKKCILVVIVAAISIYLADRGIDSAGKERGLVGAPGVDVTISDGLREDIGLSLGEGAIGQSIGARKPIDTRAENGGEGAKEVLLVRGRCVNQVGDAMEGVDVQLVVFSVKGPELDTTRQILTDRSGTFEIDLGGLQGEIQMHVRLTTDSKCDRSGSLYSPRGVGEVDLGEIVFYDGAQVGGYLTDSFGNALENVAITLKASDSVSLGALSPMNLIQANTRTGKGGRFHFRGPLRLGSWYLSAIGGGVQSVDPSVILVEDGEGVEVFVTATLRSSIRGRVVLPNAETLGAVVQAWSVREDRATSAPVRVDKEGAFTLFPSPGADSEVLVKLESEFCHSEPQLATWGGPSVLMVGVLNPVIRIEVVDSDTGDPVLEYGVSYSGQWDHFRFRNLDVNDRGNAEIWTNSAEGGWLYVIPLEGHAPKGPIAVVPGKSDLTVKVGLPSELEIRAVGPMADSLSGATAHLVGVPRGHLLHGGDRLISGESSGIFGGEGFNVVWSESQLGEDGTGALAWPDLMEWDYFVFIEPREMGPLLIPVSAYSENLEVGLDDFGSLDFRPVGGWPGRAKVLFEKKGSGLMKGIPKLFSMESMIFNGGGLVPLNPGTWRVAVSLDGGRVESPWFEIEARSERNLEMEYSDYFFSGGVIDVFLDGRPLDTGTLLVRSAAPSDDPSIGVVESKVDVHEGSADFQALVLGAYECVLEGSPSTRTIVDFLANQKPEVHLKGH